MASLLERAISRQEIFDFLANIENVRAFNTRPEKFDEVVIHFSATPNSPNINAVLSRYSITTECYDREPGDYEQRVCACTRPINSWHFAVNKDNSTVLTIGTECQKNFIEDGDLADFVVDDEDSLSLESDEGSSSYVDSSSESEVEEPPVPTPTTTTRGKRSRQEYPPKQCVVVHKVNANERSERIDLTNDDSEEEDRDAKLTRLAENLSKAQDELDKYLREIQVCSTVAKKPRNY